VEPPSRLTWAQLVARNCAAIPRERTCRRETKKRKGVEEIGLSEISEKARVRLLGGGPAEKPGTAPASSPLREAASPLEPPAPAQTAPSATSGPIFFSDSADGSDMLDAARVVQPLARLFVTPQVQTPFLAAVAGAGGAGKTFALRRLGQAIETTRGSSGALPRVVVARVDATDGGAAPVAIASAAYAALDSEPGGVNYSALLDESAHAGGDPLRAAKAAADRHEEIARKLEAERAKHDEVEARRARLADALLYETPGSRVDVFARSRRGVIESRLRRFELAGPDASVSYRDLVRDTASMGAGGRAGVALRSVRAFRGQRRLLLWAIVAFVLGFGVHMLHGGPALNAIRSVPQLESSAQWISDHANWSETAAKILYAVGALALLLNLWRAAGFSSLLLRGTQLLNHDLRDRGRDLETRAVRLNQRIAALTADAEAAARVAEAAARRAGGKAQARAPWPDFLEANHGAASAARAFLAALGERVGKGPDAPDRLVFVIDNLDALSPEAAIAWIDAAHSVLGPGSAGIMALDPARLVAPLGGPREARRRFDKWLQVVMNLPSRVGVDGERLVARLLSTDGQPATAPDDPKIATALVEPLSSSETSLLTALAPLAAHSPRDAKRFLNAYRLSRCSNAPRPVMALMQAVAFADEEVRKAMMSRLDGSGELDVAEGPTPLVNAVKSARAANNGGISIAEARAAAETARRYALSL
jgi:KAP-like P-loop domain-containing protein